MNEARIQLEAPDFAAQAVMPDGSIKELKLSSYKGKYVALFSTRWISPSCVRPR